VFTCALGAAGEHRLRDFSRLIEECKILAILFEKTDHFGVVVQPAG
jgi:hypothetical protein